MKSNTACRNFSIALTCVIVVSSVSLLHGQEFNTSLMNSVVPIAPNASALAKFADVPVSYHTGTPNIAVPVYEVKQGDLSVPVSIDYHASGIRVDDIASWVGAGWTLNAGGMISRSIRGLPDEKETYGFFTMGNTINDETNSAMNYHYLYNVAYRNVYDSQPDLYFLSLPTASTRFTFDTNQNPVLQNYQQIKIERIPSAALYGSQWKVTTADGTRYFFGEQTIDGVVYGGVDKSELVPEGKPSPAGPSSWHLYKVLSADGLDKILFQYENEDNFSYDLNLEETYSERDVNAIVVNPIFVNCQFMSPKQTSPGTMNITQKTLSRIKFDQGSVEIGVASGRYDITANRLSQISIKDKSGSIVKYFQLTHSYFGSAGSQRLKLDKVTEFSSSGLSLPPYEFQYDETNPLPARGSFKQDHWGYYNNNTKNSFVPKNIERGDGTFLVYSQGGNRETDPVLTKAGTLTKMIYPTGGYDVFDYEAHELGIAEGQTVTVYDDVVKADLKANPALLQADADVSSSFTLTEPYSADISVGGGKHGIHAVAGGASINGPPPANLSWSPAQTQPPQTYQITLNPGTYNCRAFGDWESSTDYVNAYIKVTIHVARQVTLPSEKVYAGGVRIARISRFDNMGNSPKISRFIYASSATGLSSGVLVRKPKYYFKSIGSTAVDGGVLACPYEAGYSSSKVPLGEGTHIGYSEVKILEGENGENGYQVVKFTTAADFPDGDLNGGMFPFPPPQSHDSRRGLLKEKWIYDNANHPVSATINEYIQRFDKYKVIAEGLHVAIWIPREHEVMIQPSDFGYAEFLRDFGVRYYKFLQEWQYLSKTTERTYSQLHDNTYTERITTYSYERPDNHAQLTKQDVDLKDGTVLTTKYKYPQDYALGGNMININALVTAFVLNTPVEVQTWKASNGNSLLTSSKIMDYHPQFFKPSKIWTLKTAVPLSGLNNDQVNASGKYPNLLSDIDPLKIEARAQFEYTSGRLVAQYKINDATQSLQWGYNNTFLVAEVKNASSGKWFFSGFEDTGDSNSGDAKTGLKSKINGFTQTVSNLSTGTHVLSYWSKQGAAWLQQTQSVTVTGTTYTISLTGQVDDVRLYPESAQMTSYTYHPQYGVTSMSDTNNRATYYLYDSFGRLESVKDDNGNIIKVYEYNYQIR